MITQCPNKSAEVSIQTLQLCTYRMTTVRLGVHSIRNKKSQQVLKVIQHVPHPAFNSETKANDLMLVKVRPWSLFGDEPSAVRHKDLFVVFISAWNCSKTNQDCEVPPPGQPTKGTKARNQLSGCWMGADKGGCQENIWCPDVRQCDHSRQKEVRQILQTQTCDHQGNDMCRFRECGRLSGTVCAARE